MSEVFVARTRWCCGAVTVFACAGVGAQPTEPVEPASAVVVTASRMPVKASQVVADVTVLDRQTLDRSEGRTLTEVLSQAPGLQFAANGGLGKASSLFVRGLEARHVMLLIDGVRVGSATLNTPSLDNLPLDAVDRIEIVRGPMTSLYGSNAMGGVIQVFTRRGTAGLQGNARATAGSKGYGLLSGGLALRAEQFDLSVQVQRQQNNGFSATNATEPFGNFNEDVDGFRQTAGSVRLGFAFAPGWRVQALVLASHGKTQYDDGPGVDARAGLRTSVQSLQLEGTPLPGWRSQLALGRSVDGYDTLAKASAFADLGLIETDQTQLAWENRVALPLGEALLVIERVQQNVSRPVTPFEVRKRSINALAAGWTAHWGAQDVQLSVRRDRNSQFDEFTTGAVAYAYTVSPQWRVGGSLGNSFTAPSFNQLYFPGFGNSGLKPEKGNHAELFSQWTLGEHRLRATAYLHRYDLFISSGPRPDNVPEASIDGLTLAWDASLDALALSASLDHVDPRNTSRGTAAFGKVLPRRAKQAFKASADWRVDEYSIGASLQAYSGRFNDANNSAALGGYGVLDLRGDWRVAPDWTLGLRINNLGGKTYQTVLGYNQPGRESFVTLRWAPR